MSKYAVFDIDGTIVRWQLYHAISDALIREGHFKVGDFVHVKNARMQWKKRMQATAYKNYERALVSAYDKAIVQVPYVTFLKTVDKAFEEYKEQTYTYTRNLITELRESNYKLFAISASQKEVVEKFAQFYGFDDFAGSTYKHKNGAFTGEKHVLMSEQKSKELQRLINKHGVSHKDSVGVGDSDSDIPMLEAVDKPIVFNPTSGLLAHAKSKHWDVVIERKDVVYKLLWKEGRYAVSATNS